MQRKVVCLLAAAVIVSAPPLLNAGFFSHLKRHRAQPVKQHARPGMYMRRAESEDTPGGLQNGGEPVGGPLAYAIEDYMNRAYPAVEVPIEATMAAKQHFTRVENESRSGRRGRMIGDSWLSLGPTVALYSTLINRTNAPYIASGRISALAIEANCSKERCRLYVGAAGGGIWRTDRALDDKPRWKFISSSFATNAIGAISIDPSDPSGETVYVGTGEPNASGDSEAGLGIYKSTNGGETWALLVGSSFALNRSISDIVINPTNSNIIYVGTARGVRGVSSVTGGATSNPPAPGNAPVGLYKSVDGGNTFSLVLDTTAITPGGVSRGVDAVGLDPTNPAIVYAAAFGLGVLRSSPGDAGGAFQPVFVSIGFNPDPSKGQYFAVKFCSHHKGRPHANVCG